METFKEYKKVIVTIIILIVVSIGMYVYKEYQDYAYKVKAQEMARDTIYMCLGPEEFRYILDPEKRIPKYEDLEPHVKENIRILKEQGLKGIMPDIKQEDIEDIIDSIGYRENSVHHQAYINGITNDSDIIDKDRDREFELRELYYDTLLNGGNLDILEMEPDVLYRCLIDINGYIGKSILDYIKEK